jgi:hypothetical protein
LQEERWQRQCLDRELIRGGEVSCKRELTVVYAGTQKDQLKNRKFVAGLAVGGTYREKRIRIPPEMIKDLDMLFIPFIRSLMAEITKKPKKRIDKG